MISYWKGTFEAIQDGEAVQVTAFWRKYSATYWEPEDWELLAVEVEDGYSDKGILKLAQAMDYDLELGEQDYE